MLNCLKTHNLGGCYFCLACPLHLKWANEVLTEGGQKMANLAQALNENPRRRENLGEWGYLIGATMLLVTLVGIVMA